VIATPNSEHGMRKRRSKARKAASAAAAFTTYGDGGEGTRRAFADSHECANATPPTAFRRLWYVRFGKVTPNEQQRASTLPGKDVGKAVAVVQSRGLNAPSPLRGSLRYLEGVVFSHRHDLTPEPMPPP
jgi:hypothetical protein